MAAGVPMESSFGDEDLSDSFAGGKGGRIWTARKSDGTKIASGCGDNTIKIFNSEIGAISKTLSGHSNSVNSVSWVSSR